MRAGALRLPPMPRPPTRSDGHQGGPRVSVVVNNHNYERHLRRALDSALEQEGADVEVIVVDDGSTDGSREVIAEYGDRVRAVLQENQGQSAALNAGFEASRGDAVIFLDADDELRSGTAAAVADAFARRPGAARVVFRLNVIDDSGRPTGAAVPSARMPLPSGDVREAVLSHPDDMPWPPTSGNAFAAWALRRIMPLPVEGDRTGADFWLHPFVPLLGEVVALERSGGSYRMHGANAELRDRLDAQQSRLILRRALRIHAELDRIARELGHAGARPRSVTVVAHRMISLRLGGPGHPIARDNRRRVLADGLLAAMGRRDVSPARRAAYAGWFLLAALGPSAALRLLAEASFQSFRGRRIPLPRAHP